MASIWIAKNIILRLFREKQTYIFLVMFPVITAFITMALVSGPSTASVGVAGLDNEELLNNFQRNSKFKFIEMPTEDINNAIIHEEIEYGIIFPERILSKVEGGERPEVELMAIGHSAEVMELAAIINSIVDVIYTGEIQVATGDNEPINIIRVGVGIMTMFIIMYMGYGVGVILEDKKEKTFMRSFSAPINSYSMVLGNLLANLFMGIIQLTIFIAFSTYILNIDWGVPLLQLFLILFIYLITIVGLSVGLMGFINDNEKYFGINMVIATVSCMLGGSFFPLEMMNNTLQKAANFLPQKWIMESYDILHSGGSLIDIRKNLMILVLFAIALFSFGIKTLKPREEDL